MALHSIFMSIKYILLFCLFYLCLGCNQSAEIYSVTYEYPPFVYQRDSIHLGGKDTCLFRELGKPIPVNATAATKYKDRYVLVLDNCEIISLTKEDLKVEALPRPDYFWGTELFVENDSLKILSGGEHENGSCYFYYQSYDEPNKSWVTLGDTIPNPIRTFGVTYEDDEYRVLYSERGEEGCYLIFVDKSTGKEYLWCHIAYKLIKYHGAYYAIGFKSVNRIDDPKAGLPYDGRLHKRLYYGDWSDFDALPDSTIYANYQSKTIIESGFVVDDSLYLVVNDSVETYIGKIENGAIEKVFGLGKRFHVITDTHHRRGYNVSDSTVCIVGCGNEPLFYLLDINGRKIRLITFTYDLGQDADRIRSMYIGSF